MPWKPCKESVVNFSWQIKKMEDFEITIEFINVEVLETIREAVLRGW